jgi:hypothetical protein
VTEKVMRKRRGREWRNMDVSIIEREREGY